VDHTFGEDVDPAVGVAGVARGGEVHAAVARGGGVGRWDWEIGEGVHAIHGPAGGGDGTVWGDEGPGLRDPGHAVGLNFSKEADAFDHGGLIEAAEGGVREAVGWKCLTKCEEVAAEWAIEADVMGTKGPAVIHVAVQ
jgi:hypothetical protein